MACAGNGRRSPDDSRSYSSSKPRSTKMPSSDSKRKIKYVYQLKYATLHELCRVIDYGDKWKELGGTYLGFDMPALYEFGRMNGTSPTEAMLTRWGQKDGSLDRLFVFLAHMEFAWAMRTIQKYVSDKVKHLLIDKGCTTLLLDFEGPRTPFSGSSKDSQYSFQSMESSSIVLSPSRQQPVPVSPTDSCDYNYKPPPYLSPLQREPIEETYMSPSSNGTSSNSGPVQKSSLTDNLDRSKPKKEVTTLSKVREFPPPCRKDSEKIINVADSPSIEPPLGHRSLVKTPPIERDQRPSGERRAEFQLQQPNPYPPRKMSNDSRHANEEESVSPTPRRPSDTPSMASLVVSYEEIVQATHDFKSQILGKGGFGTVFRGTWKNTDVAIKLIKKKDNPGVEALDAAKFKQSLTELRIGDWCRHDNILPLYSYSINDEGLCLVYQLMVNGSLEDRLLCKRNSQPLTWLQRCRIVRGAACGIQFLHAMDRPLIHGDIKSANILLDRSLEPKLGDFGLVREGPPNEKTHVYVDYINGTRAYLPPEYMRNRKLSTKVDTYSFGIVLFEVATGQRALDDKRPKNKKSLYEYVWDTDMPKLDQLRDPKAGEEGAELFHAFIDLGKKCTYPRHSERPLMASVFHSLENRLHVQEVKNKTVKASVGEYLTKKDVKPLEIQRMYDRLKENKDVKPKEAEHNGDGRVASNCPSPQNLNWNSPGRHATEQSVPSLHYGNTYERQPTIPMKTPPVFHAAEDAAPICSFNSRPPTYEEAVKEDQVLRMGRFKEEQDKQIEQAEIAPQETDLSADNYVPLLTILGQGFKEVIVPISDPNANSGQEQEYIQYTKPPSEVSRDSSINGEQGAMGYANNYNPPTPFVGGDYFNQGDDCVAMFEQLSLLEKGTNV